MATPTTSAPTTRAGAGVPPEAARRAMTRCAPAPHRRAPARLGVVTVVVVSMAASRSRDAPSPLLPSPRPPDRPPSRFSVSRASPSFRPRPCAPSVTAQVSSPSASN